MSRRTGQSGSVFQQNQISWNPVAPAYGRFWVDSPEGLDTPHAAAQAKGGVWYWVAKTMQQEPSEPEQMF